jgi:hypothetical protein
MFQIIFDTKEGCAFICVVLLFATVGPRVQVVADVAAPITRNQQTK